MKISHHIHTVAIGSVNNDAGNGSVFTPIIRRDTALNVGTLPMGLRSDKCGPTYREQEQTRKLYSVYNTC